MYLSKDLLNSINNVQTFLLSFLASGSKIIHMDSKDKES
jgi:hypothetical protein